MRIGTFWTIKDGKAHKYAVWPGKRRKMPSLDCDRYPLSETEYRMILAKRIRQSELNEYVDKNLHRLPEYVVNNWQDDNVAKNTAFFDDLFKYIDSGHFKLHDTISDIDFIEQTRKKQCPK